MARHRSVRGMNYDDDYDGYDDDLYGHSVEDDYGVSPSTAAQFMYGGSQRDQQQLSSFLENIGEQDEDERMAVVEQLPGEYRKPQLSDTDEARLQSCLDEIRSIVGETVPERVIIENVLDCGFRFETALDRVLNYQERGGARQQQPQQPQQQQPARIVKGATRGVQLSPQQPDVLSDFSFDRPSGVGALSPGAVDPVLLGPHPRDMDAFAQTKKKQDTGPSSGGPNASFPGEISFRMGESHDSLPLSTKHSKQTSGSVIHSSYLPGSRKSGSFEIYHSSMVSGTGNNARPAAHPSVPGRGQDNFPTGGPTLVLANLAQEHLGWDVGRESSGKVKKNIQEAEEPPHGLPKLSSRGLSSSSHVHPRHGRDGPKIKLAANFDNKRVGDVSLGSGIQAKAQNVPLASLQGTPGVPSELADDSSPGDSSEGIVSPARGQLVGLSLSDLAGQNSGKERSCAHELSAKINIETNSSGESKTSGSSLSDLAARGPPGSPLAHLVGKHPEGNRSSSVVFEGAKTEISNSPSLSDLAGFHLSSQSVRSAPVEPAGSKFPIGGGFLSPSRMLEKGPRRKKKAVRSPASQKDSGNSQSAGDNHNSDNDDVGNFDKALLPVSHLSHDELRIPLQPSGSLVSNLSEPSVFAWSLCLRYVHPRRQPWTTTASVAPGGGLRRFDFHRQSSLSRYEETVYATTVEPFNFAIPSPDDIVTKRQGAAFRRTPLQSFNLPAEDPLQRRLKDEAMSGLNTRVAQMSFASSSEAKVGFDVKEPPKVKVPEAAAAGPLSPERKVSMPKSGSSSDLNSLTSTPSRRESRTKPLDIDILKEYAERQGGKDLLNMVVIGHVDAGKSTLMGHLLYLLGQVNKRQMHKYETESKKQGKASFAYAWVLDETGEERERGITMDVGLTRFETDHRVVTLLDAPGHKDFIPNMISGAAQADVAILVIDATRGEFETGFESGGQTREHAILSRSLGVTQLAVAVNKMDTVGWSQERFEEIVGKLKTFLKKTGFKDSDVDYVPCSGLDGENLVKKTQTAELVKWYNGPCLLEQIDKFKSPSRPIDKSFRMCVSDVFKGIGAGISICGRIESGSIVIGDRVIAMPTAETGIIKGIIVQDADAKWACAGDQSILVVTGIDQMKVNIGSVICSRTDPIKTATRFQARIIVFDIEVPITKGFMVLLHYQAVNEPAVIKKLVSTLHKSTGEVLQKKPKCLTKNTNALVEIETSRPICIELYKDYKDLGRFMLRYSGHSIAAGLVTLIKDS